VQTALPARRRFAGISLLSIRKAARCGEFDLLCSTAGHSELGLGYFATKSEGRKELHDLR
jgi:hypothetical protein